MGAPISQSHSACTPFPEVHIAQGVTEASLLGGQHCSEQGSRVVTDWILLLAELCEHSTPWPSALNHVLVSFLCVLGVSLLDSMAFVPVNKIRLTSARYCGSKQEKNLISALFQTARTDTAKCQAPEHWYPMLVPWHRAFSPPFILITLEEVILWCSLNLSPYPSSLQVLWLGCNYSLKRFSGQGDPSSAASRPAAITAHTLGSTAIAMKFTPAAITMKIRLLQE